MKQREDLAQEARALLQKVAELEEDHEELLASIEEPKKVFSNLAKTNSTEK